MLRLVGGGQEQETIVNFQKVVSKCLDKPWAHIDFFSNLVDVKLKYTTLYRLLGVSEAVFMLWCLFYSCGVG